MLKRLGLAIFLFASATPALAAGALVGAPKPATYIYMTNRPSEDVAANLAMSRCLDRYGPGCHIIKVYARGCLAIAQSADGSHSSGWALRPSSHEANMVAIGQCAKNGSACHLDVTSCE
jgi:hypothetical protein